MGLLEGKIVLVTGAGSGLGKAACELFAEHGARIIAVDINGDAAEQTVAGIRKNGCKAVSGKCDVSDLGQVEAMVALAVREYGRLDVIYNNAATTIPPAKDGRGLLTLGDTETAQIDRLFAINVRGVMNGCKAAARQFELQGGGGVIVNTASVAGLIGYGGVAYGSTKAAVVGLTRTLAIELAPNKIRVNSVCPAGMLTNYAGMDPDGPDREKILEGMGRNHPLGRAIDPLDTANAALFFASDLSSNVTGVNMPVDGGLSAGISLNK